MKKAIKILAIIFAIITGLSFVSMLIMGFSFSALAANDEYVKEVLKTMNDTAAEGMHYTYEEVVASLQLMAAIGYMSSVELALSCGLNITFAILASKKKEYSKYVWISLGIAGIFFTNLIVSVLAIVYGATLNKNDSNNNSNIQEVHFTEKVNDSSRPSPSDYDAPDHLE